MGSGYPSPIGKLQLYDELRLALGKELNPDICAFLEKRGTVRDRLEDAERRDLEAAVADLLDDYRAVAELVAKTRNRRRGGVAAREIPADPRAWALGRILALEAARLPDVLRFRHEVLNDQLLRPEEVSTWIGKQAEEDGPATWQMAGGEDWLHLIPETLAYPVSLPAGVADWTGEALERFGDDPTPLRYPAREGVARLPIPLEGVLGNLKRVAETLTRRYPVWHEATAVEFILTGETPPPRLAYLTTRHVASLPALDTVTLEVSPRLSPFEVKRLYAEVRGELLGDGRRDRPPSEHRVALGLFAAEHNDGRSWREAMDAWNASHHGRQYEAGDWRRFARDCRVGYERITGAKLQWASKREPNPTDTETVER
jgi:hypothetical protein